MRYIELNYPHSHHHPRYDLLRSDNTRKNGVIRGNPYTSWHLCGKLEQRKRHGNGVVVSQVMPLNMETFSSNLVALDAVAKPPDTQVLLETGGLMLFVYFITNFLVPQFVIKSLELDQVDENQRPNNENEAKPVNDIEAKAQSRSSKRGFNSTKPK